MNTGIFIFLAGFSGLLAVPLAGQTVASPPDSERPAYVRRFSLGGRLSVLPLNALNGGTLEQNIPTLSAEIKSTAESESKRAGGGVAMQFALGERIALNLDLLYRKIGYRKSTETRTGVDNPATTTDERKLTATTEQTRASVWELPVLGRYYMKSRHESGPRSFFEAGVAIRRAGGVITFTEIDDSCCDQVPASLAHRYSTGLVAGAGVQLIDDYGVRVIPEVRYTRWLSRSLDSRPARSASHQLEVLFGITF